MSLFEWKTNLTKATLNNILLKRCTRRSKTTCDAVGKQCRALNKKTKKFESAINRAYVRDEIIGSRTLHLLLATNKATKDSEGFLVGSVKTLPHNKQKVFYIDLVCSAHRKGRDLLTRAEIYALSLGYSTIGLRAATPALLNIYRRRGFKRDVDACKKRTRTQRRALRHMDVVASKLFQQGSRSGWQTSGEGWWMSKCTATGIRSAKAYVRKQPDRTELAKQLNRGIRKMKK